MSLLALIHNLLAALALVSQEILLMRTVDVTHALQAVLLVCLEHGVSRVAQEATWHLALHTVMLAHLASSMTIQAA